MATPTPAELLFEGLLPLFLKKKAATMQHFRGTVHLELRDPADPRTWTLTGGQPPYLARGALGAPDVRIEIAPSVVTAVLTDQAEDLEAFVAAGELAVSGDARVLKRLELSWSEARDLLGTRAGR